MAAALVAAVALLSLVLMFGSLWYTRHLTRGGTTLISFAVDSTAPKSETQEIKQLRAQVADLQGEIFHMRSSKLLESPGCSCPPVTAATTHDTSDCSKLRDAYDKLSQDAVNAQTKGGEDKKCHDALAKATDDIKTLLQDAGKAEADLKKLKKQVGSLGHDTAGEPNGGFATKQLLDFPGEKNPSVAIEIGLHNTVMAPLGPENHVIGIEASLQTIYQQWRNLAKPGVLLLNAAMFDRDALSVFQVREGWPAANSLVTNTDLDKIAARFQVTKQDPVATLRLEHVFDAIPKSTRIDILKVDVQGVNWNVITSAGSEIARARSVFTECTRDHTNKDGETGVATYGNKDDICENIRQHLENHGFTYLGMFVEGMDDVSADIMLVKKSCLELAKPCAGSTFGAIGFKNTGPEKCLGRVMHENPTC